MLFEGATLQINGFFCNFLKQIRPFSKINMIQSLRDISNVKGVIHKIYRNFPLFVVYCTTSRTWTAFLSPTTAPYRKTSIIVPFVNKVKSLLHKVGSYTLVCMCCVMSTTTKTNNMYKIYGFKSRSIDAAFSVYMVGECARA